MDVVTKEATATATIEPVKNDRSENGEALVILSTSALDRDGDELHPDEWKQPLPDYITFDIDHGMSVATTVGGGTPYLNDKGQLEVPVGFSSLKNAQDCRTLVNEGIIRNVSVAFLEHKDAKSGKIERELLNGAFVAVPANPEAVILASKAKVTPNNMPKKRGEPETKDGGNFLPNQNAAISDMFENDPLDGGNQPQRKAYWQGIHDVAVKLGAGCPYSDPQATPGVLNGVGNRGIDEAAIVAKVLQEVETLLGFKASPTETTEESTAETADEAAEAADESADDVARAKALLVDLLDAD